MDNRLSAVRQYIDENRERFYEELFTLLRIPSVSAQAEHKGDMVLCAERMAELLKEAGADEAGVYPTEGNPVVFASKTVDPALKTVLVYGHYDVQPAEPLEKWHSDPFEPVIHDGAIWGRGANDDKGQTFMHVKAFEYLLRNGLLEHNVKFIIEGEEEIGSKHLAAWVEEHREMLACDIILVSDTTMISDKVPSINCGMRGVTYLQLNVKGPDKDLHSGHYGGAVANPINTLCDMISSLIDKDGRVTIPGFYDDVVEVSREDRDELARAPFDMEEYKAGIGIREVKGEKGYTTLERTAIRACLDVCGIWGGYTGAGSKTVLPSEAHAKISMRIVPNQKADRIIDLAEKHLKAIAPDYVEVSIEKMEAGNGFLIPITSTAYQAASKAMAEVYGIEPVPSRGGGSICVLADMRNILGADPLLMGFGLERDTIHSPNESYLIRQLEAGIESIALFYEYWK
ncbi:MAG: dipeptidase [Candidatus Cryptobacteroides sp.]|nr:dipeptidase [Candidatus Cryptobacteroides sp.]